MKETYTLQHGRLLAHFEEPTDSLVEADIQEAKLELSARRQKLDTLSPKERQFCYLFVNDETMRGNASACYKSVFKNSVSDDVLSDAVKVSRRVWNLLKKPAVKNCIQSLLAIAGFNVFAIDNKLLSLINSSDESISLKAIQEFNRMFGRIIERAEVESKNEHNIIVQVVDYANNKTKAIPIEVESTTDKQESEEESDKLSANGEQGVLVIDSMTDLLNKS